MFVKDVINQFDQHRVCIIVSLIRHSMSSLSVAAALAGISNFLESSFDHVDVRRSSAIRNSTHGVSRGPHSVYIRRIPSSIWILLAHSNAEETL